MFQITLLTIIFLTGLITGSFLNCVIYRLETGENFLKGRSHCPYCGHILGWKDLIPVLSFLILKGRCRYCQKKISLQYPLVEIATGLLFLQISNFQFSWTPSGGLPVGLLINEFSIFNYQFLNLLFLLFISCFLIIIFVYDFKHYIIPDKVIYPAIFVCGIWYVVFGIFLRFYTTYDILNTMLAALGAAAFFLAIVLVSRGKWMGAGDIKLAFLMGLLLGWPNILVALFFAFFIGAIIGIELIVSGKKTKIASFLFYLILLYLLLMVRYLAHYIVHI